MIKKVYFIKAIILAAGEGKRLRPLTNDKPKSMVLFNNKPIIDYILASFKGLGVGDIAIVNGYKKEVLKEHLKKENVKFFTNENYSKTNMVSTLFCAKDFMDDDLIISYADIIYKKEVLQKLIDSKYDFSVVVDKDYKKLWSFRMDNPLDDLESLKVAKEGNIVELGKKVSSYEEIQGQYIGLVKISKEALQKVKDFYFSLDKNALYDGKDYDNMYMTSFIQLIIDRLLDVYPVYINSSWVEIDSLDDLNILQKEYTF